MSSMMLATSIAAVLAGSYIEKTFANEYLPILAEPSHVVPFLPRSFGLVVLVLTFFSWFQLFFGMTVGKTRKSCKEAAEKDGEKNLHIYSPPYLYSPGTSKHSIKLNDAQRAHQHVLESMTSVYMSALFNALVYPLLTALITAMWVYGRMVWANSYANSGADKRYEHFMAFWIWRGLLINYLLSFFVGVQWIFGSLW